MVVSEDEDLVFASFQVVVPSLKGLNNGQELLIVSVVSCPYGDYFFKEKGYYIPLVNFERICASVGYVIRRMWM